MEEVPWGTHWKCLCPHQFQTVSVAVRCSVVNGTVALFIFKWRGGTMLQQELKTPTHKYKYVFNKLV